jgi:hypothetical protein
VLPLLMPLLDLSPTTLPLSLLDGPLSPTMAALSEVMELCGSLGGGGKEAKMSKNLARAAFE